MHILGKKIFYALYRTCLNKNEPFFIEIGKNILCPYNLKICGTHEYKKYNLLNYYNEIKIEKKHNDVIPDITLINNSCYAKPYFSAPSSLESVSK